MTTVAVTSDRFIEAAPAYEGFGLTPVPLPCIRVHVAGEDVLEAARTAAENADLVVVSSSRTLDVLWPKTMPPLRVMAVGPVTAARTVGLGGSVTPTGGSGLTALIETNRGMLTGRRVAFPHARESDPYQIDLLRSTVGVLDEHEIYSIVPIAPANTPVEAVSFASPSAVDGWNLGRDLTGLTVASIGETTTRALSRWRPPDVVASTPSHPALARALAERFVS